MPDGIMKVLVVDDSETNRVLLNHLLAMEECEVVQASDGIEAIELVKKNDFALILLDIQMPQMDGYETALAIKEVDRARHVPIIFITAIFQDQENVNQGYASGAVDYLFRPVDVQALKSKVNIFLELHRQKKLLEKEIEEHRRTEEKLRRAEEKYRSIFERAVEGIFRSTVDGRFLEANPALVKLLGYESLDELLSVENRADSIMVDRQQRRLYLENIRRDGVVTNYEFQAMRRNGQIIWCSESSRLVRDEDGNETIVGVVEDVTARKKEEKELQVLATMDSLTRIPNRHVFFDRLEHAINSAQRYDTRLAVLFVDLDDFKSINDSNGHQTGDVVLRLVAERIQKRIRAADTLARIGGDEFGILLERLEDSGHAGDVAAGLIEIVSRPYIIAGREFHVGATVGISVYPEDGDDPATLLGKADEAMYGCKRRGECPYGFYGEI
ncbi:GGDEF domain-containing response regulator [Desulfovibrio oxyclinae]|uniref:GGDEF domain-containing response regulator n=1 Tax=Desulfovibrio oxyclinae TaxID=63560 RepID=UPI000382D5E3|nr:diguanylate cyclase [Desulfovibrio oxyclinae]